MGGSVGKAFSNPVRAVTTLSSFGTSELARKTSIGNQVFGAPERLSNQLLGTKFGSSGGSGAPGGVSGGQSPAELLATTGGAPLLTSIALGGNVKTALAGYFGQDDFDSWFSNLADEDKKLVDGVRNTLDQVQTNTNMRNEAVQKVVADFPNVVNMARQQGGQEFDEVTKGMLDSALAKNAAKYNAGGNLSSGAANEAAAKAGVDYGMQKLDYMGQRENSALNGLNLRLGEVNALRDFQNTMLGVGASQGFSANQANLDRIQKGSVANADISNQRYMQDQQANNQMLGAIGQVGGMVAGRALFGPIGGAFGGSAGQGLFAPTNSYNKPAPKLLNSSYDNYSGRA